jgi:hypothetical protein
VKLLSVGFIIVSSYVTEYAFRIYTLGTQTSSVKRGSIDTLT